MPSAGCAGKVSVRWQGGDTMKELRLVLLGLAAIIALVLGTGFLMRAFRGPAPVRAPQPAQTAAPSSPAPSAPLRSALSPQALATSRAALEHAIADAPDYARFFDRLRLAFPNAYDAILNTLAAFELSGGRRSSHDPASRSTELI